MSSLLERDQIPNARDEIPAPEIARNYSYLTYIVSQIPPLDGTTDILILIGRDLIEAHHVLVLDQRVGPQNTPYAHKLPVG